MKKYFLVACIALIGVCVWSYKHRCVTQEDGYVDLSSSDTRLNDPLEHLSPETIIDEQDIILHDEDTTPPMILNDDQEDAARNDQESA